MKKSTKFLTVFLLALLGANLQPMWAEKITSTTWACLRGTFYTDDWGDIGMTSGGTDYYTGAAYIVAERNISFKLKAGGNNWEYMYGLSDNQTYDKENTDKSGWYNGGNNVNLNIMSAASGWVKIDYAFWGDNYGNSRVTITQSEYKSFSLKHLWPNYENWGYKSLNIDNGDGTFSVDENLRDENSGFNWHLDSDSGDRSEFIQGADITKVGSPVEKDYCRFTFNPKTLKITITRYMQVKFMNESTEVSSVNVLYNGSTTTPSAPSKIGYRFLGWSKDGGSK